MKAIKINLYKFLILGLILISCGLLFAGCNLSNNTPADTSVSITSSRLDAPEIAENLLEITQVQYNTIPKNNKPALYNSNNLETAQVVNPSSLNWSNKYYIKSVFGSLIDADKTNKSNKTVIVKNANLEHTKGYVFGFYDGLVEIDPSNNKPKYDYSKFTEFTVLDNTNSQTDQYSELDFTNYINEPKTYYFYVRALGIGYYKSSDGKQYKFSDSLNSQIYAYSYLGQCESPTISNSGNQIFWNNIENAKSYNVFVNGAKAATITNSTSCDLDKIYGDKLPIGKYNVQVQAVGNNYYLSSISDVLNITNTINLSVPSGFVIDENNFVAQWEEVPYANEYVLEITYPDGIREEISTTEKNYNLLSNSKVSNIGKYYLRVKAVRTAEIKGENPAANTTTFSSLYTPYLSFKKDKTLASPTNLTHSFSEDNVVITWEDNKNTECSYSVYLKINADKYYIYYSNCETLSCSIDLKKIKQDLMLEGVLTEGKLYNFTIGVKANGYGEYCSESSIAEKTFMNLTLGKINKSDFSIQGSNLVWNIVPFAKEYKIVITNEDTDEEITSLITQNNYLDLSQVNNLVSKNIITVEALSDIYENSPVSDEYKYIITQLDPVAAITTTQTATAINLQWQSVDNAKTYGVYLDLSQSQKADGVVFSLTPTLIVLEEKLTAQNGVVSYSIDFETLLEECAYQKYLTYYIYVICNGYDGYRPSNKAVYEFNNTVLQTPTLTEHNGVLYWDQVDNDAYYNVYLEEELIAENLETTSLDVSSYLTITQTYNFILEACHKFYINSFVDYAVDFVLGRLDSPTLNIVNNILMWEPVEKAEYYNLYIDGVLTQSNISDTQLDLSAFCVDNKTYTIGLQAQSSINESNIAEITYVKGNAESIEITNVNTSNHTVSFNTTTFAESFDIYLNNMVVDTISNTSQAIITYNYQSCLNQFLLTYKGEAVSLTIAAKNSAYLEKTFTNSVFVYEENSSATQVYYVFEKYYDNYIDNKEEFIYACLYSVVFDYPIEVYINYSYASMENEIKSAVGEALKFLTTYSVSYRWSYTGNKVEITFTNKYPDNKTYATNYNKTENNPLYTNYVPQNVRNFGSFYTDNLAVSLNINNSDQLYWTLMFGARPVFNSGVVSQKCLGYYEEAKNILNSILPSDATDYEKAYIIAEYIMANAWYDFSYYNFEMEEHPDCKFHHLEGFFTDGLIVCDGYAKTYSLLCNMEGIKTYVISGDAGGGHAWNKIYLDIDGEGTSYTPNWYMVDLTWCDGLEFNGEIFYHEYFLLQDLNPLLSDRTIDSSYWPTANGVFDYYNSNLNKLGVYLNSSKYDGSGQTQLVNCLETVIYAMYIKGETSIDIKITTDLYYYLNAAFIRVANNLLNKYGLDISRGSEHEYKYGAFSSDDSLHDVIVITLKK